MQNSFPPVLPGDVTSPRGFRAAGVAAAIKKPGILDMALVCSDRPAAAAAVYTTNQVKAAPLLVNREHLAKGTARAVVVNAGNANACNGEQGLADARRMAALTGTVLGIDPQEVVVASTGVIGKPLPMDRITAGIHALGQDLALNGGERAARAILTTDLVPKTGRVQVACGDKLITIGAMAKGSGMIHPNMATMLAFFTTDARITPELLRQALRQATAVSFNMLSVDGDTSTNDMALVLANGEAGNLAIEREGPEFAAFTAGLTSLAIHLAKAIARDGEGATKLLEVRVKGAATPADARLAALAVVKSSLVKTAVFGGDANWGRVLCAVGYSGAAFDPDKVDIFLGPVQTAKNGGGLAFSETAAAAALTAPEVVVTIDLKEGSAAATAWGCDLTYNYVKINADYRT